MFLLYIPLNSTVSFSVHRLRALRGVCATSGSSRWSEVSAEEREKLGGKIRCSNWINLTLSVRTVVDSIFFSLCLCFPTPHCFMCPSAGLIPWSMCRFFMAVVLHHCWSKRTPACLCCSQTNWRSHGPATPALCSGALTTKTTHLHLHYTNAFLCVFPVCPHLANSTKMEFQT